MTNIYDALEACLHEIENGANVESALLRYSDISDELRPILEAAMSARQLSAAAPAPEVVKRNRTKVLDRAAELRESTARPLFHIKTFAPVRRLAFTLVMIVLMFVSGTSLVGAASTSLPGDRLYPVKRSWERLQLILLFDEETRNDIEVEHENERVEEVLELFAGQRYADVSFSGLLTHQDGDEWLIAGIRVVIAPQADLPAEPLQLNSAVRVHGSTQVDGSVLATRIELLPSDAILPEVEDEPEQNETGDDESDSGSENEAPEVDANQTPESVVKFDGTLDVLNSDFWTINGMAADVSSAEIVGTPSVGAPVIVEGYFNPDGAFVVTRIRFEEESSNSGEGSGSNPDTNDNDSNNDNEADDSNDNDADSENDNDNEDNSGPGGGDDD